LLYTGLFQNDGTFSRVVYSVTEYRVNL